MGLALDEPQSEDERHEVDGLEIYLDRYTRQVEAILIDYSSHPYFGGFHVSTGQSSCC